MNQNLPTLKAALDQRWEQAFDEFAILHEKKKKVRETRYSDFTRHNVRDYDGKKLKAGGKMYLQQPEPDEASHAYGYDGNKKVLVCDSRSHESISNKKLSGYYNYEPGKIEYIEFDMASRVPYGITQLILEKGKKLAYLQLTLNYEEDLPVYDGTNKTEIIQTIKRKFRSLKYRIDQFEYLDDRIANEHGWRQTTQKPETFFRSQYHYADNGELRLIEMHLNGDISAPTYYKSPNPLPFYEQSKLLSSQLIEGITAALKELEFDSPVFAIELSYPDGLEYFPTIQVITESDKEAALEEGLSPFFPDRVNLFCDPFELPDSNLEKEICGFTTRVLEKERWDVGNRMVQTVAATLQGLKKSGVIPTTEDFVVYAIDFYHESGELEDALIASKADKKSIREWRKNGWLEGSGQAFEFD